MKAPRFSIRRLLFLIAATAIFLTVARIALPRLLGPRPGFHHGRYWYFDENWKYHEVRGTVIWVGDGIIFVD